MQFQNQARKMLRILLLLLLMQYCNGAVMTCEPVIAERTPVITVPGFGNFEGSTTASFRKQREVYQFLGIPYAIPPLGSGRFKAPVPLNSINPDVVYEAKYFKRKCPQLVTKEDYLEMQKNEEVLEDCLHLNVYTPAESIKNNQSLPVMIYIHGGGNYQGFASDFCPNYLLDHNIVLVTIQYRLGPFGFLDLQIDSVAGNMGLLDQLTAIQWIHKYIRHFGGDNKKVTIAGQSSGGVSVSLLLTSPLIQPDLFQKVIIQSGNLMGEFAVDHHSKENGLEFASYVNCTSENVSYVAECLRKVSVYDLVLSNLAFMARKSYTTGDLIHPGGIDAAVIQKAGSIKFLESDPRDNMRNGNFRKIPVLTGVTKDEGSFIVEGFERITKPKMSNMSSEDKITYINNQLFNELIRSLGELENEHLLEAYKILYLPNKLYKNFKEMIPALSEFAGAIVMKSFTLEFARYTSQYTPTYLYSFNFKGQNTKLGYGLPPNPDYVYGVAHSDDLIYLLPFNGKSLNEEEMKIVDTMTHLWAKFITNEGETIQLLNNGKWPAMSTNVGPYLEINKELKVNDDFVRTYYYRDLKSGSNSIHTFVYAALLSVIYQRIVF